MFSLFFCLEFVDSALHSLEFVDSALHSLEFVDCALHSLEFDDSVRTELEDEDVAVCILSCAMWCRDEARQVDVSNLRLVADSVQRVLCRVADDHRFHLFVDVTQRRQCDV